MLLLIFFLEQVFIAKVNKNITCRYLYCFQVHGAYHQLDTPGTVLLGGASMGDILVHDLTRGHFEGGFQVTTVF